MIRTTLLFILTAVAEIVGCYLPFLVLKGGRTPRLLSPAGFSLALFAWLLTLHPTAAGRVCLCRLWRGLCLSGAGLVAGGGWGAAYFSGPGGRCGRLGGDGVAYWWGSAFLSLMLS